MLERNKNSKFIYKLNKLFHKQIIYIYFFTYKIIFMSGKKMLK